MSGAIERPAVETLPEGEAVDEGKAAGGAEANKDTDTAAEKPAAKKAGGAARKKREKAPAA
ncbi:MAG: hypothetical protein HY057_03845 [Rhodospirillales bacterium]|nr:hypothetical protein [Rhodospirillales bacterium]